MRVVRMPLPLTTGVAVLAFLVLVTAGLAKAADGPGLARQGIEASREGRLDDAIRAYDRALAQDDLDRRHRAIVHNNRGYARYRTGDPEGALADYSEAIALDSGYVGALDNRAWVYRHLGQPRAALTDYDRAIEIWPTDASLHNNRGLVLLDLGRLDAAIAAFDRALDLGMDADRAAWPLNNRGTALARKGDLQGALAAYDAAIEADPEHAPAWFNRGDLRALREEYREAARDYGRAIELDPEHEAAYGHRGAVWERLGNWESAWWDYHRQRNRLGPDSWVEEPIERLMERVGRIQDGLNRLGYDAGEQDGRPGQRTRNAIRAFQQDQGLDVDGRLSRSLLERIESRLDTASQVRAGSG